MYLQSWHQLDGEDKSKGVLGNLPMPPPPRPAPSLSLPQTWLYGWSCPPVSRLMWQYLLIYFHFLRDTRTKRMSGRQSGFSLVPVSCPMVWGKGSAHTEPQRNNSLLQLLSCVLDANISRKMEKVGGEARKHWKKGGIIFPSKDEKIYPKQGISKELNDGL